MDPAAQQQLRAIAQAVQHDNWNPGEPGYANANDLVFVEMELRLGWLSQSWGQRHKGQSHR